MRRVLHRSLCRVMACVQHAVQGCGGFNRYAHSAVPNLDDWMFGGLQVWRIAVQRLPNGG